MQKDMQNMGEFCIRCLALPVSSVTETFMALFVDEYSNLYFCYSAHKIVVVLYETTFNSIVKCHVVVWK